MRVIVTWDERVTCHGVDVIVIGNGLVHRFQHDHHGTLAFDETVKRKQLEEGRSNIAQLTRSHGRRRACKRRPGKESPHLNRSPNQKDLNDDQYTLTAIHEVNELGVQLATTNQSGFALPCVYRV